MDVVLLFNASFFQFIILGPLFQDTTQLFCMSYSFGCFIKKNLLVHFSSFTILFKGTDYLHFSFLMNKN